jgi:non-heme chloroperoxidase
MDRRAKLLIGTAVAAAGVTGVRAAATAAVRRWSRAADPTNGEPLGVPDGEEVVVRAADGAELSTIVIGGSAERPATFVLSHCWTGDRRIWGPVAQRLAADGSRVVLYDQRGHGGSTVGHEGLTISALGSDLRAVLEHLDIRDAVVAGHSMGGMATQAFATEHGNVLRERVRGLGLVSTACGELDRGRMQTRMAARVLGGTALHRLLGSRRFGPIFVRGSVGKTAALSHLEAVRDTFVATPPGSRAGFFEAMAAMDLSPHLREVDLPAVVVVGTRDQLTPVSHARRLAELLPAGRLEVLPDAGHMLPCEEPDRLAELIRSLVPSPANVAV